MPNRTINGLITHRLRSRGSLAILLTTLGLGLVLSTSTGCVRLMSNIMHAIQGNERPAEYNGFEEQRVAVVCSTDQGLSNDATAALVSGYIHMALNQNVKKIELVRPEEIDKWLDSHGTIESDYVEIGKAVNADKLLAVDISNLRVKDGPTLYRGRCDVVVNVYDINNKGAVVFNKQIPEFNFPEESAVLVDTTEAKFRNKYLKIIAKDVAEMFYPVEANSNVGRDATANSF